MRAVVPLANRIFSPSSFPGYRLYYCRHFVISSYFVKRFTTSQSRNTSTMSSSSSKMNLRDSVVNEDLILARKIFEAGVDAAIPSKAMKNTVSLLGSILKIHVEDSEDHFELNLKDYAKCHIVGFGKAVLPMAEELLLILEDNVAKCILSVPNGMRLPKNSKIEMNTGAKNNIPDQDALTSAERIHALAKSLSPEDLLIVLISGGGSALLSLPKAPITLEEKSGVIKQLSRAGASIVELNTVRKRISVLKGGGLVKICPAKRIISLILSDVLNDPLDIIASGPTVRDTDDSSTALEILKKYLVPEEIPSSILSVLESIGRKDENFENEAKIFDKVSNIIIGNNRIALRAAADFASRRNLKVSILSSTLEGDARILGKEITELAINILEYKASKDENEKRTMKEVVVNCLRKLKVSPEMISTEVFPEGSEKNKDLCLLLGGETTVNVTGTGIGGRNQEFALASAVALNHNIQKTERNSLKITILCAGTDGIDGPCDAAGAVVDSTTFLEAKAQNIEAGQYLDNNDSYNFFKSVSQGKFHVITGNTNTNVMDLIVLLIRVS